jgi:hypothetical protein
MANTPKSVAETVAEELGRRYPAGRRAEAARRLQADLEGRRRPAHHAPETVEDDGSDAGDRWDGQA